MFAWPCCCYADFDVNAVVGILTVGGVPAAQGSLVRILDHDNGFTFVTDVDGQYVPPFLKGQGRYDTGDVPAFSTGDRVTVFLIDSGEEASVSITLQGGTNMVNLSYDSGSELGTVSGTSPSSPTVLPNMVEGGRNETVQAQSSLVLGGVKRQIPGWSLASSLGSSVLILATLAVVLLGSVSYLAFARRRAGSNSRSPPVRGENLGEDSDSC